MCLSYFHIYLSWHSDCFVTSPFILKAPSLRTFSSLSISWLSLFYIISVTTTFWLNLDSVSEHLTVDRKTHNYADWSPSKVMTTDFKWVLRDQQAYWIAQTYPIPLSIPWYHIFSFLKYSFLFGHPNISQPSF